MFMPSGTLWIKKWAPSHCRVPLACFIALFASLCGTDCSSYVGRVNLVAFGVEKVYRNPPST